MRAPEHVDSGLSSPGAGMWASLARLIRLQNQSGTWLLLWPSLWALWFASRGLPPLTLVAIFSAGAFLMRSAGVILNDLIDRHIDRLVARTRTRPLAAADVTVPQAVGALVVLLTAAAALLTFLPPLTWILSPLALVLAAGYPLAKRVLAIPQAILGIAFGWGAIMAWAAVHQRVDPVAWLVFFATVNWAVAYDTIYALQDRDDDRRIGVKSSALFFGDSAWIAILVSEVGLLACLAVAGWLTQCGTGLYVALLGTGVFLARQSFLVRSVTDREEAFRLFSQHVWVGAALLAGIALGFT